MRPEAWRSKHPPSAPYFWEFLPLIRDQGGVENFDPEMSYKCFIPAGGSCDNISSDEIAYVSGLIRHADGRSRIPVLTASRSLGRVRGLKAAFPGLHLLIYRNIFHQWCSVSDQSFRGNPYFIQKIMDIVQLNRHDSTLDELHEIYPTANPSAEDAATFYIFVFLHLHLYVQSAGAADLIVDLNRLEVDQVHREAVENSLLNRNIVIDLSGTKNSIASSMCRFSSTSDVREHLKVIGDIVIDRAPDVTGRVFGAKIVSELLEEYDRHEFYTGGLRSLLIESRALLAKIENLPQERDAALAECNAIRLERDDARAACDQVRVQRDTALVERDALRLERDGVTAACDVIRAQRDEALVECNAIRIERDDARATCDRLRVQRDAGLAERDAVRLERDDARVACDRLRVQIELERDAARRQAQECAQEGNLLSNELEQLMVGQTTLHEATSVFGNRMVLSVRKLIIHWFGNGHRYKKTKEQVRWRRAGDTARDASRWALAAHSYERYLKLAPYDHAIWVQYGHALKEVGMPRCALVAYERSKQLNPNDPDRDVHLCHLKQLHRGQSGGRM